MNGDERFGLDRKIRLLGPVKLDSGAEFESIDFAYETYGELNADKSNAILICHALTGDQFVASRHPVTGKDGWWMRMVGIGKPIDPARHCVISIMLWEAAWVLRARLVLTRQLVEPLGWRFPL